VVLGCSLFYDFCKLVIIHPFYMISSYSSSDSNLSYDILDLADIANLHYKDSTPQSVANDAPQSPHFHSS